MPETITVSQGNSLKAQGETVHAFRASSSIEIGMKNKLGHIEWGEEEEMAGITHFVMNFLAFCPIQNCSGVKSYVAPRNTTSRLETTEAV